MRPLSLLLLAAHLTAAHLGMVGPALAQAPSESAEDPTATRARDLFAQGLAAFDAERYEEAKRSFEASFRLRKAYDTAGLLGQVELELGEFRYAAEHIEYCIRNFPTGGNRELYAEVQEAFAGAKRRVGTLRIAVKDANVDLFLDGRRLGGTPLQREVFVEPGQHTLRAQWPNASSTEETFRIEAGQQLSVDLQRPALSSSPPGADRPASSEDPSRREWLPAYLLGGVTAVTLATSIALRVSRADDKREVEQLRSRIGVGDCAPGAVPADGCSALVAARDRYNDKGMVADVALAVGGVAAAATLGYAFFVLLDEPTSESGLRASASLDATSGGVVLTGSF